jgi:hypothetical protein
VPLADLLGKVSQQLRELGTTACTVESAIEPLLIERGQDGLVGIQGLQELDRLIQYIDGLADYVGALSVAAEGNGGVDPRAAQRLIKVAKLAEGLGCVRSSDEVEHDDGFEML